MARPKSWNSPTAAIRVPAHAVDAVMALARQLDSQPTSTGFVQNPGRYLITIAKGFDDEARYLLQPPADISEAEAALVDGLVDQFFAAHDERDLLAIYSRLVEKTLTPLKS